MQMQLNALLLTTKLSLKGQRIRPAWTCITMPKVDFLDLLSQVVATKLLL